MGSAASVEFWVAIAEAIAIAAGILEEVIRRRCCKRRTNTLEIDPGALDVEITLTEGHTSKK